MARQAIRFNYFIPELNFEDDRETRIWDMKNFLEYMLNNKYEFDASAILGDEIADFEWDDAEYDEKNNLYRFCLSKLRSKNTSYRKRINAPKHDIVLADDEYLGDYTLLIYDPSLNTLVIQSNFYGLTTKQTSLALSEMRRTWKNRIGENEEDNIGIVNLAPVPDNNAINRALESDIYRNIEIKCSNTNAFNNYNLNSNTLNTASKLTDTLQGHKFEIKFSMGQGPRNDSLDENETRNLIHDVIYLREQDEDVQMHVSTKEDEEHAVEVIDLIKQIYTTNLVLPIVDRQTIGAEYMYQNFLDQNYFDETIHARNTLERNLPHP